MAKPYALKASNLAGHVQEKLKARAGAAKAPGDAHAAFRAAEAEHEGASKKWVDAMIAKHPDEEAHRSEKNKAEQRVEAARGVMHAAEHERHGVHPNDIKAGSKEGLSLRKGAGPLEKARHDKYASLQDARKKVHDAEGAYHGAYDSSDLPDMRKEEHAAKAGVTHAHAEYEKAHEAFAGSHEAKPAAPKSAQEQHAEKLKTFASSGKAAESSKKVGAMLAQRKMPAGAIKGKIQAAIQTSAKGAKFYMARSGQKVYVK